MDSRAVQSHAHQYDEHHNHPHDVGLQQATHGSEEHQHDNEKMSVLKKVKAKAKKIKDNITKHGHHDNEHGHEYHYEDQHIPDDHDLDEDDDEDEEMIEDPEVHGAPIYDSAAVQSARPRQTQNLREPGVNFGGTSVTGVEPHHQPRVVVVSPTTETDQSRVADPARTFVGVGEDKAAHHKVNLERPMGLEEDPHAPGSRLEAHAPANYQTKVTDPTGAGGAEIDVTPVEKSLARMNVHNEPKPNPEPKILPTGAETQYPSVGCHHQFVPELSTATKTQYPPAETHDQHLPQLPGEVKTQYPRSHDMSDLSNATKNQYPSAISHDQNLPQLSSATRTPYPSAGSHDQFVPELPTETEPNTLYPPAKSHDQNLPQQSKTEYPSAGSHDQFVPELSTPTKTHYPSSGSHDQFSPEPIPTSMNTYEENPQPTRQAFNTPTVEEQPQTHYESMEKPSNQSSYTDKISSATSAIADKAITAKNVVASKLDYGEKESERDQNETTRYHEETRSGEKPSNQSSYTEKISSATSAVADKAVSAKNTVASKLGYGDKSNRDDTTHDEEKKGENVSSSTMSGSPTEYGKKIALSLTEKLAPVYGKVAGVGTAVKSKVPGTGTGIERESDKGVSVKDYFAEKLRPGDEDRALSQVISETLHKRKEEPREVHGEADRDVKTVVSDAIHKRGEETERAKNIPLGKVTESEEVKRRLGSGDEETERRYEESYANSPGKGVVDKLKGVVGSWFGKPEENQSLLGEGGEHLSKNSGAEFEQVSQAAGERRLQESSN